MSKVTIKLPSGDTESVWVQELPDGNFLVENVPFFAKNLSCGDIVSAEAIDGTLKLKDIVGRGGHSTYRVYCEKGRQDAGVQQLLERLRETHCDIEPATDNLVAIDVLPEADIYQVYGLLEDAEKSGLIDFQEGHCGHPLRSK